MKLPRKFTAFFLIDMKIYVFVGHGFSSSHHKMLCAFPTLSRTFIVGCICLTKNNGFFTQWCIYLFLLCPTHVFFMLCNHETHFVRCPITKLTTHSPRMMNDYNHAHTHPTQCDVLVHMQCKMSMHVSHVTCTMNTTWNNL